MKEFQGEKKLLQGGAAPNLSVECGWGTGKPGSA